MFHSFGKIRLIILFVFLTLAISATRVGYLYAQPGLGEAWSPPEYPSGVKLPIGPSFYMYFEDRNGNRKVEVYTDEYPVYLIISIAPGTTSNIAWAIQYQPPDYQIRSWLFQRQMLGGAGTYRLGPYATVTPRNPAGPYAFRVGILSTDATGDLHWRDQVIYLTYSGDRPPTTLVISTTVVTTVTTSASTRGFSSLELGMVIFIGLITIALMILFTRRKPLLEELKELEARKSRIAGSEAPPSLQAPSATPHYDLVRLLPEQRLLAAITAIRLPEPRPQHSILDKEGRPFTVADFAYPDRRIAIYIDSYDPRLDPRRWENDLEQTNKLIMLGWKPLRFPASKVLSNVEECVKEIEYTLRAP